MEEYKPTQEELKLQARFTFEGSMHLWELKDKALYLKYLNNRAGLPFGTIGMIRTEHKNKDGSLNVKEIPYASRQTTVELGRKHKISIEQMKEFSDASMVRYTYRATDIDTGRYVEAVGACSLMGWGKPLTDDQKANKFMHAETKAKRRATLEVCGLAFLDDTEVDDMENTQRINVETGEVEQPAPKGNGKAATTTAPSTADTTPVAPPATTPDATATTPPSAGTQPVAPPAVAPPAAASTFEAPMPARFAASKHLFVAATADTIVADPEHMNFIVNACKNDCGWDGKVMSQWLLDTFGVRSSNAQTTLTLDVFARIAAGIDAALTAGGR